MQLFYPVTLEEGVKILRVKLRSDAVRLDENKNITCYASRETAQRKALESKGSGRSRQEMFLVVVSVAVPGIMADLRRERPVDRNPLAIYKTENRDTVLLSKVAQDMVSRQGDFSLEIVPGTEDLYIETYHDLHPVRGVGLVGPRK